MKSSSAWDDATLLSRIEDAGINASTPAQQRWIDGWLVRLSPGKAKRARCVNALAIGRLALEDKLRLAATVFAEAALPMLVRITPFSQPETLDADLARRGFAVVDDTRVMVASGLAEARAAEPPADTEWVELDAAGFASAIGGLRGSPSEQQRAHADRLGRSPVPFRGCALRRRDDGGVMACGQFASEAEFVGIYDVFTAESARGRGLASLVRERLLALAAAKGATVAYLQVEADNAAARHIYRRLGFADAYAYHYRQAP